MDDLVKVRDMSTETKTITSRIQNEDGSSVETRIEEVKGGYIKTVETRFKNTEGDWDYKTERSVGTGEYKEEETKDELTLVEKLAEFMGK